MAGQLCDINDELLQRLKKFRFDKGTTTAAIVLKVDRKAQVIEFEEEHEDLTLEELQDELPGSQPRFVVYRYPWNHDDGRVSYPIVFIFVSPQGCQPELQMLYAGSMQQLVKSGGYTKVFEVRSSEDLTEEWLLGRLKTTC